MTVMGIFINSLKIVDGGHRWGSDAHRQFRGYTEYSTERRWEGVRFTLGNS